MTILGELTNHVWQSTVFAAFAGLMTLGFRTNRAQVRYGLWLGASFKFLLPFSLLLSLGNQADWAPVRPAPTPGLSFPAPITQFSQPFPDAFPLAPSPQRTHDWIALSIFGVWACGFVGMALLRARGWRQIQAAVRASTPIYSLETVPVRSSPGLMEPGVIGLFRPILLLPAGLAERLSPPQLAAVLAHEMCHVRRRDNLVATIHMAVEAIFWFHPLVWWIGARLVEERERACDEAVLSQGNAPHDYAEGILNVSKSYVEAPLSFVSGVTGPNLKQRIEAILTGRVASNLSLAKKVILATAGFAAVAVPVLIGVLDAPRIRAQSQPGRRLSATVATPEFETVSIKPCITFRSNTPAYSFPGKALSGCTTLQRYVQQAFGVFSTGHTDLLSPLAVTGGPAWADSELFEIDAKAAEPEPRAMMNGPMLQALLEKQFHLRTHRETRPVAMYALRAAAGGPKLQPFQGTCIDWNSDDPGPHPDPDQMCGRGHVGSSGLDLNAARVADLRMFLLVTLGRPVIDATGLTERFNFHLDVPAESLGFFRRPQTVPALRNPSAPPADPALISAIKAALMKAGLSLEPVMDPGEFIVIDHVEKPSGA